MFGTILGPLPAPDTAGTGASLDEQVRAVLRAQEEAGLEPVTDGGLREPDPFEARPADAAADVVEAWSVAAAATERMVKQALPGPYTLGRRHAARAGTDPGAATDEAARALNARIRELVAAGCPYVEVHEPDATAIGADADERRRFVDAQAALLDGVEGTHLSLAITGGNADGAGAETILASRYQSLAVDLIAGPDNWRLVTAAPATVGIVCGALRTDPGRDDGPEVLVWATRYAASSARRGLVRVGLGTASGLAHLTWDQAVAKMRRLGKAARLAGLPPGEELASSLDHRALDLRTRAVGRRPKRDSKRSTEPPPKGV